MTHRVWWGAGWDLTGIWVRHGLLQYEPPSLQYIQAEKI